MDAQVNRRKRLKLNMIFGLLLQATTVICGFIMPRLILSYFGSEVNGLVNSITSLLNIITFAELGVGAVVQSNLYKPLAENDMARVSQIVAAAKKFFRIVGILLVVLVLTVALAYPFYVQDKFDIFSTISLVLAMSISLFAQYFFGVVYNLLLVSDQKNYIVAIISIITLVLNTALCAVIMKLGGSIQIVKLSTSVIFLARPIFLFFYVRKKYNLVKVQLTGQELPQKWDGIVQHVASYVLDNTDIVILTIFASLSAISVYSTYYLIAHSIRLLVESLTSGVMSYYGNVYAKGENELLRDQFSKFNFYISGLSSLVFSIACALIVPFVLCYTSGIYDADYDQLLFGILLLASQFFYCTRHSFNMLILSVGHYKETKISAIVEAVMNLVISISLVIPFGIVGVAIGTLCAMLFRTIYFAIYCSKHIINRPISMFIKDIITYLLLFGCSIAMAIIIRNYFVINNYLEWLLFAVIASAIMAVIFILINIIFNRRYIVDMFKAIISMPKKLFSRG